MPILDDKPISLHGMVGWVDYNDLDTHTSPVALTLAETFYPIPNDGLGLRTNKTGKIPGHGEIWNTATNLFDWSSLNLFDLVIIRYDFILITGGVNHEIRVGFEAGIGATPYTLILNHSNFKIAGEHPVGGTFMLYMGDANTLDNGARFVAASDNTGDTIKNNGWVVSTLKVAQA